MKIKTRPELKIIAESLKTLKSEGIIRTKNLVGDLGEYYCQELLKIELCKIVEKGFDGFDTNGKKVEIKTRRQPTKSAKVIFRGFEFDYCLFVELNEYFEPISILKIDSKEIVENLDKKGDRLSVRKLKTKTENIELI
ncbi:hypothetical protein KO506_04820 [Polaribacter vadi]|uniref:DUF6998 domain-containing protein n=1 Tax=Polaribacter TaxID=52959 RepID=UPI001C08C6BE|nr:MULTISPECIES: hypothetical protein [Polaribacter]MBU3010711.1 hypothetical protein [Polaribacter vadi]MDO6740522.1 hypothetical protein [Polaribacter sp. 1_MG-2023]